MSCITETTVLKLDLWTQIIYFGVFAQFLYHCLFWIIIGINMRWKKRHSCLKETRRALDRLWLDLFPLVTPNLVTLDEKNPDLNEAVLASFQDIYYSLEDHYKLGEGAVRHLDRTSWSKPMDKLRAVYRLEKKVSKLMGDAQTLEAKVEDFLSKEGIDFGCHVRRPRVAKYVKVATSPSSQV